MMDVSDRGEKVPVNLGDGVVVKVEVTETGREKVGMREFLFEPVAQQIEKIVQVVYEPIQKAKPTKASVTFGLEIGVEEGSLMAAIVRGTGTANLEITLEWENKDGKDA